MQQPLTGYGGIDDANTYDLCLVFQVGDREKNVTWKRGKKKNEVTKNEFDLFQERWCVFVGRLEKAGLKFTLYKSQDEKDVFCLVTAPEQRLKEEAEKVEWDLELDPDEALEQGKTLKIRLAELTADPDAPEISQFQWKHLYGPFQYNDEDYINRESLYLKHQQGSPFRTVDRIKLLYVILESERRLNGCNFEISTFLKNPKHPLVACFPFHEKYKLKELESKMVRYDGLKTLPLKDIRNYFGEQIGMYFAFLQFYTKALIIPAVFGVFTFIWQMAAGKFNIPFLPVFGVIVCLWATIFLEAWKRHESIIRGRWGMATFAQKEQPRPGFKGDWKPSLVDGEEEEYYPTNKKIGKCVASHSIIFSLIGVVIGLVSGILWMRTWLTVTKDWSLSNATYLGSFLTALGIQIMNFIYGKVASTLNDWENHKTDTEYENSQIAKTFLFKFVNSYYSLFYIAFIQKIDPGRGCPDSDPNCMGLLRKQLGTIFVTQIVINNLMEFVIPKIKQKISSDKHAKLADASDGEKDFYLKAEYGSTLNDFDEITIQYGYAALFVLAFPITPLFAFLNNIIENMLDSYNLCHDYRRPEPRGAYNIGTWYSIFEILGYATVVFNVALITVFGDDRDSFFKDATMLMKFGVFIAVEHILFFFKFSIAYFIPDEPIEETYRLQRQRYLVDILVKGVHVEDSTDEDDEHLPNKKKRKTKTGKGIERWLKNHQLTKYSLRFKEAGYVDMRKIRQFEMEDVEKMIKAVGIETDAEKELIRREAPGGQAKKRRQKRKQTLMDKYSFGNLPSTLGGVAVTDSSSEYKIQ